MVLTARRPEPLREAAEAIGARGLAADTAVPEQFADVVAAAGAVDLVVHAAGVMDGTFVRKESLEAFETVVRTNLTSAFVVAHEALPAMGPGGRFVFLSSSSAHAPQPGRSAYSASKAGLHAVTLSTAKELGKFGIRVNSLSPAVATDMTQVMDERLRKVAASRRPLKIDGSPRDVAEGALFLVSDRSRFVTGDTLHVDGGLHLN